MTAKGRKVQWPIFWPFSGTFSYTFYFLTTFPNSLKSQNNTYRFNSP